MFGHFGGNLRAAERPAGRLLKKKKKFKLRRQNSRQTLARGRRNTSGRQTLSLEEKWLKKEMKDNSSPSSIKTEMEPMKAEHL